MTDRCDIVKGQHVCRRCGRPVVKTDISGHETGYCSALCYERDALDGVDD